MGIGFLFAFLLQVIYTVNFLSDMRNTMEHLVSELQEHKKGGPHDSVEARISVLEASLNNMQVWKAYTDSNRFTERDGKALERRIKTIEDDMKRGDP